MSQEDTLTVHTHTGGLHAQDLRARALQYLRDKEKKIIKQVHYCSGADNKYVKAVSVIFPVKFKKNKLGRKHLRNVSAQIAARRPDGRGAQVPAVEPERQLRRPPFLCENYARLLHLGVLLKTSGIVHYHIKRPV